jgi:hypothetical protein
MTDRFIPPLPSTAQTIPHTPTYPPTPRNLFYTTTIPPPTMPTSYPAEIDLGTYIVERWKQLGIKHVFGVPGDFNLGVSRARGLGCICARARGADSVGVGVSFWIILRKIRGLVG